jgi:Uma2 family endonuclease
MITVASKQFVPREDRQMPLESGDRLTRDEFERRYTAMGNGIKAELIEGVVYMSSPVRQRQHGGPHSDMIAWLGVYRAATPGIDIGDNSTIRLDAENEPQPDALLYIASPDLAQTRLDADGYLTAAPELIAEIAASSASYDLHDKLRVYQRSGVREYIVWRVLDDMIDWFVLRAGSYHSLEADTSGLLRSDFFPGLWLDRPAMLRRDLATVLRRLQEGIATVEHAEFALRLSQSD